MAKATATQRVTRPSLDDPGLAPGKRARLRRMMYEHGCRSGTLDSANPVYQFELAVEGGYNVKEILAGFSG